MAPWIAGRAAAESYDVFMQNANLYQWLGYTPQDFYIVGMLSTKKKFAKALWYSAARNAPYTHDAPDIPYWYASYLIC